MDGVDFEGITPDKRNEWLNQSNSDFETLLVLANRETKFAKTVADKQAVFGLFTNAVKSNRDDWVYDFEIPNLRNKALFFADTYNESLDAADNSYDPVIKWSRDLRNEFQRGRRIVYSEANRIQSLYRPFVIKQHFADYTMNDVLTLNHYEMFGPELQKSNKMINFCVNGKAFYVLATDKPADFHFTGDTQCLPLADRKEGAIVLDDKTTLEGVPPEAWEYQLGSRSALEWVLDQYKERKPRDPTIAERFNAYRFADHKEQVIDLLRRVCAVSVKTMDVVDDMAYWEDGQLIVFGDRDKREWTMLGLEAMFSRYDDSDDDLEYQAWLASLPDIREGGN